MERERDEERAPRLELLETRMWSQRGMVDAIADEFDAYTKYMETIVAPFLGAQYLPLAKRVANVVFDTGPQKLSDVTTIAIDTNSAMLMTDGTLLAGQQSEQVVCIEIKPKFGGLVHCETVPDRHHIKRTTSRYQLHQTLKLEQGVIDLRSAYDPIDLFSGDPSRIQSAVEALMDAPQNNLAVFVGGDRVDTGMRRNDTIQRSYLATACAVLERDTVSHLAATVRDVLLQEGILDDILRMQSLCPYDIHAVEALCRQLTGDPEPLDVHDDTYDLRAMQAFLDAMAGDEAAALDVLVDYCTAATAKDCSILIAMTRLRARETGTPSSDAIRINGGDHNNHKEDTKQGLKPCQLGILGDIAYRVTVVDLDRKRLQKLAAHKRLDLDILRANVIQ